MRRVEAKLLYMTLRLFLVCLTIGPLVMAAQDGQAASSKEEPSTWRKLKLIDTRVIEGQPSLGLLGQQKCDGDGNIYFQPSDGLPVFGPKVDKIDVKEMKLITFSLDQVPDLGAAEPGQFSVMPDGSVFLEARSSPEPRKAKDLYIIQFEKDGRFKDKTKIDGYSWEPDQLVLFPHGEMLMGGRERRKVAGKLLDVPFTGVFDSSGSLSGRVSLPQDKEILAGAYGDIEKPGKLTEEGFRGINLGSATPGPDGMAYLMRYSSPVVIYGISAAGTIEKEIKVTSPEPGLYPASFVAFGSGFVIRFLDFHNNDKGRLYEVVDLDGDRIAVYDGSALPSAFVCYSDENKRFTFISSKDKQMAVAFAEPE